MERLLFKKSKKRKSTGFVWNLIGGSLFAGQSVILLFLCARIYDQETAGVVSIAYAVANLIYMIALYGVRNFQVTDSNEQYRFKDYFLLRLLTILIAVILLLVYMLAMYKYNAYTIHKCAVVIMMTMLKMVNAVDDVFGGRFQQRGYFAVGARIGAIREFMTLILISVLICLRADIVVALGCGVVTAVILEAALIEKEKTYLASEAFGGFEFDKIAVSGLLKNCLPLCISTVLAIYLSNIPKYVTDWYLDELTQAIVGYLLLPVFTIALFNQFIYTPFIKNLGDLWNNGDRRGFVKRIGLQSGIIILSSFVVLFVSYWIGIPLLSLLYNIDLSPYITEFILLLTGGGLYALEYYLIIPVTVMHEQKKIAYCFSIAIAVSLIIQRKLAVEYGLMGIGLIYIIVNLFITILLGLVIFLRYKSEGDKQNKSTNHIG